MAASVATALAGLDLALVSTAMPRVATELGGLDLYAWTFSTYLLSSTIVVPIYGKLADLFGRKPTFLVATTIFVLGSALCGAAQSMPQLIAFRLIQGIGGGGVYPVTLTIVGDVFELEERARLLGVLAAIWGVAAVIGPAVGGLVTEQLTWRWAFFIQLPLALLTMVLIARSLHEHVARAAGHFDFLGALLLASAAASLLGGLQLTSAYPLLLLGVILSVALVAHERRALEPLIPPRLFRGRVVAVGTAACLVVGMVLYGVGSFAPPLVQGVLGASPTVAGLTLSCMSIGWPIAANLCGRMVVRWGYRVTGALGGVLLVLGFVAIGQVHPDTSLIAVALIQVLLGAGFGLTTPVVLLSMQSAVDWTERGVVTGINQFATNLGGAVGVAVAGVLFANALRSGAELNVALAPVFLLFLVLSLLSIGFLGLLPRNVST